MLFLKECRKILFSLTFLIYVLAVLGFYFTQFHVELEEKMLPPTQGQEEYGMIAKEIPEILMPAAAESLVIEYCKGYYTAYPIGFYKEVKLSEKKQTELAEIITEITGISKQALDNFSDFDEGGTVMQPDGNGGYAGVYHEPKIPEIQIPETLTYEQFREKMRQADDIIGGGSKYSDDNIVGNFSCVPKTYEDALAEYNAFLEKDHVTSAYARLFCDYMGIIVAVLPVFVAAALANTDRKSRMEQLIYARNISSVRLLFTRYTALIVMLLIPVMILSIIATFGIVKLYPQETTDFLAVPGMSFCWLVPNILFSSALGMLLTEIFSPLIAIVVQGGFWFASVISTTELTGSIGRFTLVCRHNSLYKRMVFMEDLDQFIFNRIFYTILAILLMIAACGVYHLKRKGSFYAVIKNPVRQSKA